MNPSQAFRIALELLRPFVRNQEKFHSADTNTRIWEDLQVNSARFVDILLRFEEELDVEVDDTQAEGVSTVGDVANLLLQHAGSNPEAAQKAVERFNVVDA